MEILTKVFRNFPFVYSADWTSEHAANWTRCLSPLIGQADLRYLEIGVFQGRSSAWMMSHILSHPSCRMVGIDTFRFSPRIVFWWNMLLSGNLNRTSTLKGESRSALENLEAGSFDLIYVPEGLRENSERAPRDRAPARTNFLG